MGHGTMVQGVQRTVGAGFTQVVGVQRKLKQGLTLVNGVQRVIDVSGKTPLGELAVGSSVFMNVNGASTEFLVVHQGNPDSSFYNDTCAGTWLLMKDIYTERPWNGSNSNIYNTADINIYLRNTFAGLIDTGIQSKIKTVNIPYALSSGQVCPSPEVPGAAPISTKFFLLAAREVGSDGGFMSVDGRALSYFGGGSTASAKIKRVAHYNGAASPWWLRSHYLSTDYPHLACSVSSDGSVSPQSNVTDTLGVRPACIMTSDALVDENFNVIDV